MLITKLPRENRTKIFRVNCVTCFIIFHSNSNILKNESQKQRKFSLSLQIFFYLFTIFEKINYSIRL